MSWIMRRTNRETGETAFYCENAIHRYPGDSWRKFYYTHDENNRYRTPEDNIDWVTPEDIRIPTRCPYEFESPRLAQMYLGDFLKMRAIRYHAEEDQEYNYDYVEYMR